MPPFKNEVHKITAQRDLLANRSRQIGREALFMRVGENQYWKKWKTYKSFVSKTYGISVFRLFAAHDFFYLATKRALLALSEVLQLEHRADGIRVSVILPGITATAWDGLTPEHPSKAGHLHPSEIAEAVLWCCTRTGGARVDTVVIHPSIQNSV